MTRLRQLWMLTALGSLAALAGGYFLLVSPQANKAAALRDEAETQLQANKQLQTQIAMLNKQKKDLPNQQGKLNRFAAMIPNNPALPSLIRGLSDAADVSGVELVSLAPQVPAWSKPAGTNGAAIAGTIPAPNGTVLVDIPVAMTVTGTYGQISQFFHEVEKLRRVMLVSGFSVAPGGPQNLTVGATTTADGDLLTATIGSTVAMTAKAPAPVAPPAPAAAPDATK
jgi:Tfp pilus assembly protein PilO